VLWSDKGKRLAKGDNNSEGFCEIARSGRGIYGMRVGHFVEASKRRGEARPENIRLLRLAAGQSACNWQARVLPRKGLPFRDSKAVPSKGWVFDNGRASHQRVLFSESYQTYDLTTQL
jgi:hypothetical protein